MNQTKNTPVRMEEKMHRDIFQGKNQANSFTLNLMRKPVR